MQMACQGTPLSHEQAPLPEGGREQHTRQWAMSLHFTNGGGKGLDGKRVLTANASPSGRL